MLQYILNNGIPPAIVFIAGALLIPVLKGRLKTIYMLLIPVAAFYIVAGMKPGEHWVCSMMGYELILGRIDRLAIPFAYIFILITFIGIIYAINVEDDMQYISGFVYAGSALGVTFAGDLFTLYIFWEIMAVSSTFLILARRTKQSEKAAMRYILVHVFGGLCLLAGIIIYIQNTGTTRFSYMELKGVSSWLIFTGIAVNAAIPPLHPWLKDAYPEATVAGAVFLSAFTTKSAVYVMARIFPGAEPLIWIGAMMTIIPIFYAEVENDMRRVLSYSLMNQVGFMMCGIGIGTKLSINGTVSHAFAHIIYKALLFMSVGAAMHVTGRVKATDLGGLYRTMPLSCICCLVGAMSISAFPLTSGFVSKSMIISASGYEHYAYIWLALQFASAGVIAHAGIKVPFFTYFGHDAGIEAKDPPKNMLIAMGIASFLCIYIGVKPDLLYSIMPFPVEYVPYTGAHIVHQLQLLMFGVLAFYFMLQAGSYPSELRAVNLDTDWFYRIGSKHFSRVTAVFLNGINSIADRQLARGLTARIGRFAKNGPAKISVLVMSPFIMMGSKGRKELLEGREKIQASFDTGSFIIGLSACIAVAFLCFLFFVM